MDKDILILCAVTVITIVLTVAIVLVCTVVPTYVTCKNAGNVMGKETNFEFFGGCFIGTEEGFVPLGNYRVEGK